MPVTWLYRFAQRTHPLVLPILFALVSVSVYLYINLSSETGYIRELIGDRKTVGIFILFSLLPAYLVFMMTLLWRRAEEVVDGLRPLLNLTEYHLFKRHIKTMPTSGVVLTICAVLFGAWQNRLSVHAMLNNEALYGIDVAMFSGNCILWGVVGLMLSWCISVNRSISRLGATMALDIYRLDKLTPLARLATTEILIVVGAMAFMPLQSLDANLDPNNYLPGIAVGIPAGIALFLLPLWGAHKNIMKNKAERLSVLYKRQDAVPRHKLDDLETITAHIDRVKSIPHWPIDVQLITRIFFYVVIAPLAWVAAALVENLVDRF